MPATEEAKNGQTKKAIIEKILEARGNAMRTCTRCEQSFEVPTGYGDPADWQCAICSRGGPICQHTSIAFGQCEQCGCLFQ